MNRQELLKALKDLKELHDQGILTQEEFAREKEVYLQQLREMNISVSASGSVTIPPEIQALDDEEPPLPPEPPAPPALEIKGSDFFATGGFSPLSWDSPAPASAGPPPPPQEVASGPPPPPMEVIAPPAATPLAPPAPPATNPFAPAAPPSSAFSVVPAAPPPALSPQPPVAPATPVAPPATPPNVAPAAPVMPPLMPGAPPPAATLTLRSLPKAPPKKPPTGAATREAGTMLIDRYRLGNKLGESGLSRVFLAEDTWTEEPCVIKIIRNDMAQKKSVLEHLGKELEASRPLQHPGLANATLLYEDPATGLWFYATDYVEGETLQDIMEHAKERGRKPLLPLARCGELMRDISAILGFLAKQQRLHKDVKPSNIFLKSNGQVVLTDAGVLTALFREPSVVFSGLMGMVSHTAPELLRGAEVTAASDVYSLGVVLYQLLTGHVPIGRAVAPSEEVPSIPAALDDVVLRALSEKPEDRYRSAPLFARAVQKALRQG